MRDLADELRALAEVSATPQTLRAIADVVAKVEAENEMLWAVLKSAKPVKSTARDANVRRGFSLSGEVKYYRIEPHIVHKAIAGKDAR